MIEKTRHRLYDSNDETQGSAEVGSALKSGDYRHKHAFKLSFRRTERKAYFSQSAIEALGDSSEFQAWNAEFETLVSSIRRRVSPRDIRPLLNAGAEELRLLTLLAFAVYDSDEFLSQMIVRRKQMTSLAAQLFTVWRYATRLVNDPCCDGRFWMALEGLLSWDEVPIPGRLESGVLERINALAMLLDQRAKALGKLSRRLKVHIRRRGIRNLLAYIWISTRGSHKNFDCEVCYLLSAAFKAIGKERYFTPDQLKKLRQRHLPNLSELPHPSSSPA